MNLHAPTGKNEALGVYEVWGSRDMDAGGSTERRPGRERTASRRQRDSAEEQNHDSATRTGTRTDLVEFIYWVTTKTKQIVQLEGIVIAFKGGKYTVEYSDGNRSELNKTQLKKLL